MKTSQSLIVLAFTLALTGFGCSAKVDGGDLPFEIPNIENPAGNSLNGTYATGCVRDVASGVYMNITVEFAGTAMKVTAKIYSNSSCSTIWAEDSASGTFALVGQSEHVANASKVDYELKWADGRIEKIYDIVLLEGSKLFMGSQQGTNPQSRATEVDRNLPYQKVK